LIRWWIALGLSACIAGAETFPPSEVKVIGPIDYGEVTAPVRYSSPPRYRAFEFNGKPGDRIEIWVHARRGVPEAFLTDSNFKSLAGGNARFSAVIPPDSKPATYYIVFRGAGFRSGLFNVELQRPAASATGQANGLPQTAGYLACSADSDCIAVDRAGCCHNGYKDAVNKDKVAAYKTANACHDPHVICAMFMVNDDRVAVCNTAHNKCEMVKPESIQCGGFIRNAHSCPAGYTCKLSNIPDAGGTCVKN
jgi:hypothetical protein